MEYPAAESTSGQPPAAAPENGKPKKAPAKVKAKASITKSEKAAQPAVKAPAVAKKAKTTAKVAKAPAPVKKKAVAVAKTAPTKKVAAQKIGAKKIATAAPSKITRRVSNKAVAINTKVTVNVGGRTLEFTLDEADELSNALNLLFKRIQIGASRKTK